MSCGSFAIVFSCVVVCEMRDKVLEMMDEREKMGQQQQQNQKPNFKLDFFQSVVYPQHNRPRTARRSTTHNSSSAAIDPFPSCAVGASGSKDVAGPSIQMAELRPSDNPSPVTASSLSSTRVCPLSCGRVDAAGTLQASSCPGQVTICSDGLTSDRPYRRATLLSAASVDETELCQAIGCADRKRLRYSSEPLLLLHHGRHGRPNTGIRWAPVTQGATAVLLKADGRGWPPERKREGAAGRLLLARVQTDASQRPQHRVTKRLLVSRKPVVRGGRGTGFHTSSVEVLIGQDDARLLHDSNKDAAFCPDAALNTEVTAGTITTGFAQSFSPPRPTQVQLKAHIVADSPPNVLVHQAYVHAEPDRGTPVTSILPPPPKSILGTTSLPRITSPPGMTSLPVKTSSPGMTPLQGVTSPPGMTSPLGVTSLSFMTSLPRMTTACPGRTPVPPLSHRLSLPAGDSDSGFAFSSMQISANKCSSRLAIRGQKQQHQQQQYQQPPHEHQSQKMRVRASRTSSIKDFC